MDRDAIMAHRESVVAWYEAWLAHFWGIRLRGGGVETLDGVTLASYRPNDVETGRILSDRMAECLDLENIMQERS